MILIKLKVFFLPVSYRAASLRLIRIQSVNQGHLNSQVNVHSHLGLNPCLSRLGGGVTPYLVCHLYAQHFSLKYVLSKAMNLSAVIFLKIQDIFIKTLVCFTFLQIDDQ